MLTYIELVSKLYDVSLSTTAHFTVARISHSEISLIPIMITHRCVGFFAKLRTAGFSIYHLEYTYQTSFKPLIMHAKSN